MRSLLLVSLLSSSLAYAQAPQALPKPVAPDELAAHSAKAVKFYALKDQVAQIKAELEARVQALREEASTKIRGLEQQIQLSGQIANKSIEDLRKKSGAGADCRLRLEDEGPKPDEKAGGWACPEVKK